MPTRWRASRCSWRSRFGIRGPANVVEHLGEDRIAGADRRASLCAHCRRAFLMPSTSLVASSAWASVLLDASPIRRRRRSRASLASPPPSLPLRRRSLKKRPMLWGTALAVPDRVGRHVRERLCLFCAVAAPRDLANTSVLLHLVELRDGSDLVHADLEHLAAGRRERAEVGLHDESGQCSRPIDRVVHLNCGPTAGRRRDRPPAATAGLGAVASATEARRIATDEGGPDRVMDASRSGVGS